MPKTPTRTVRVPTSLWNLAKERAQSEGRTITAIINECLIEYVAPDGE